MRPLAGLYCVAPAGSTATDGDKRLAAQLLGISVSSVHRRLWAIEDEIGA